MAKSKPKTKLRIPKELLAPVGAALSEQLKNLKKRSKEISKEDPFKTPGRATDNASPDTDADEQFGHAKTSAIKSELDKKIIQTRKAMAKVKVGSYGICEECGALIDTDRLMIYPEATLCVHCEKKREKKRR